MSRDSREGLRLLLLAREGAVRSETEAPYTVTTNKHADDSSYAWGQSFDYGYQDYWRQDDKFMARAVRRVTIRQFRFSDALPEAA